MARLSSVQRTVARRVADLAAAGLSPERLGRGVLDEIALAIPGEGMRLFGVDPTTLLVNRLLASIEPGSRSRLEWLRDAYLSYGPVIYGDLPNLMRAGVIASAFHERQAMCWGVPPNLFTAVTPEEHYRRFHEMESPVGGGLQVLFRAGGRWVAALQLYRRDRESSIRSSEVAFVRSLAPTIGEAMAAALARERALSAPAAAGDDASGILVLDRHAEIRFVTPAGEAWLERLRAGESAATAHLPTALWSAVGRLRAAGGAVVHVTAATPDGAIRVEVSPAGGGDVAVVVSPVRPPALPAIPDEWPLTRQERAVVAQALRGAGNREIAGALSIAEHTVETHLRNVYGKLEVRGRTQLLARLFRETFWPALEADWAACQE